MIRIARTGATVIGSCGPLVLGPEVVPRASARVHGAEREPGVRPRGARAHPGARHPVLDDVVDRTLRGPYTNCMSSVGLADRVGFRHVRGHLICRLPARTLRTDQYGGST